LLQEAAEASGLVEVRRGHRARGADQDWTAAVLTVDGQYTVAASWAIGADGARSTVRGALGFAQPWRDYGSFLSCCVPAV
jgi:2-polyprenyl-6-methoxyphenol hydroxylase-like FAD-dependent oxidoreductase